MACQWDFLKFLILKDIDIRHTRHHGHGRLSADQQRSPVSSINFLFIFIYKRIMKIDVNRQIDHNPPPFFAQRSAPHDRYVVLADCRELDGEEARRRVVGVG